MRCRVVGHAAVEGAVEGVVGAFWVFTPTTAAVGAGQVWSPTLSSDRDDVDQFVETRKILGVSTVEIQAIGVRRRSD
jgi:hypothetical protein